MASVDLGHYMCLFAIVFVGYSSVGTLLLGDRLEQFKTLSDSCCTLFMICMGWETLYRSMVTVINQVRGDEGGGGVGGLILSSRCVTVRA